MIVGAVGRDRVGSLRYRRRGKNLPDRQDRNRDVRGGIDDVHTDPVCATAEIYSFVAWVVPDFVTADSPECAQYSSGRDIDHIAATAHETLIGNQHETSGSR